VSPLRLSSQSCAPAPGNLHFAPDRGGCIKHLGRIMASIAAPMMAIYVFAGAMFATAMPLAVTA